MGISRDKNSLSPLRKAVLENDVSTVKQLLSDEKNFFLLTQPDTYFNLPLNHAAARGHSKIAHLLIRYHQSSPYKYTTQNDQGYHPLVAAAHWWCKAIQGLKKEDKPVGKYNEKDPEKAYPAIMHALIDNYSTICNGIEIGKTERIHNTNALYHITRIMTLQSSRCGDIAIHRQKAQDIAKKLLMHGVSLDIRTEYNTVYSRRNGNSARSLAKLKSTSSNNVIGILELMESNAKKAREEKEKPNQLLEPLPKKKEHTENTGDSKNEEFSPPPPKTITQISFPNEEKQQPVSNHTKKAPSTFQNEKWQDLAKKTEMKFHFFSKKNAFFKKQIIFNKDDIKQIIENKFPGDSKYIVNKENHLDTILDLLSSYYVMQGKRKLSIEIINKNLLCEYQYRGIFCKKKECIILFDQAKAAKELGKSFLTKENYKEKLIDRCLNP